jgi:hypothetical protein
MANAYLGVDHEPTSGGAGTTQLRSYPLARIAFLQTQTSSTRGNQRLPRRFAPRNDEILDSNKINNLRNGFMERSAATWRSPVASSYSVRPRRLFPPFTRGSGDCHVASLLAMTRLQAPVKSITYAWGSWRGAQLCCDFRLPQVHARII